MGANKIYGVDFSTIAKINGIDVSNIAKINGIDAEFTDYLLDTYTNGILGISNRQLKSGITNVLRVRDSGDSTEADYTPAQITAGLTGIGADSGFVTKAYDQAGVLGEVVQSTAASQMRVLNAGTLETLNGLPAWNNENAYGLKSAASVALSGYTEFWLFFVVEKATQAGILAETSVNYGSSARSFKVEMQTTNGGTIQVGTSNESILYGIRNFTFTETGQLLVTVKVKANTTHIDSTEVWVNGSAKTGSTLSSFNNAPPSYFSDNTINLFARNGASTRFNTRAQEAIIFIGDQSSNRTAIEENINTYYGIY